MLQAITSFHRDEEGHWVARLSCGHNQHVRHDPPLIDRLWVTDPRGRAEKIGKMLECIKCDAGCEPDPRA